MQVIWTIQAISQLDDAYDYIEEESGAAAENLVRTIARSIMQLEQFPSLGRLGRVHGTRELVVSGTPYIAAYRLYADRIEVLAIVHGAMRWPEKL